MTSFIGIGIGWNQGQIEDTVARSCTALVVLRVTPAIYQKNSWDTAELISYQNYRASQLQFLPSCSNNMAAVTSFTAGLVSSLWEHGENHMMPGNEEGEADLPLRISLCLAALRVVSFQVMRAFARLF